MQSLEIKPLYMHPWPVAVADMALVRDAKDQLDLPYRVKPQPVTHAVLERILALREAPPWVSDYALVADPARPGSLRAALEVVFSPLPDPRLMTVERILDKLMPGTVEITRKQLAREAVTNGNISRYMEMGFR